MVNVLVPKQHEEVIKKFLPTVALQPKTEHLSTFKINAKKFISFYEDVIKAGYKPYSLMRWQ